jgi:hypothetical protein
MNASSLRRSAGALQPRRGGVDNEPEWKLYEEGDPRLYENWKGKEPGALSEDADIDPSNEQNFLPDLDTSVPLQHALLALGSALGLLAGIYYYARPKKDNYENRLYICRLAEFLSGKNKEENQ